MLVKQGEKIEYGSFAESTKPTTSASYAYNASAPLVSLRSVYSPGVSITVSW